MDDTGPPSTTGRVVLPPAPTPGARAGGVVDLDLHGLCGIRVVDPGGHDAPRIAAQLGLEPRDLASEPDLTIRVGDLPTGDRLVLGDAEYGAVAEGLLVLRGPGKRAVEMLVPFDALGSGSWELTCAPGSAPLPLLVSLVNLLALSRRVLALHAAAMDLDGTGVLVTGWSKSGKTETLLALAAHGARCVGDEWVYLDGRGVLRGLPEPMRLWQWHLRELGARAPALPRSTRARLTLLDRLGSMRAVDGVSAARRARHLIGRQANVRVPPAEVVPLATSCPLDVIVLTETHSGPGMQVVEVDSWTVARRVAAMLPVERNDLLTAYQAFRYAFPDRHNSLIDRVREREAALLAERFAGRPAFVVRHPRRFRFGDLADAIEPVLRAVQPNRGWSG